MTRSRFTAGAIGVIFALLLLGSVAVIGPAAGANNTTNYYNNSTGSDNVTALGWVPGENATLDNVLDMATRLGPYFIGTGEQDPSGTGYVGLLLLSLVLVGATVGSMRGAGVGPIGGSIIGMTLSYALVEVGLAPPWVKTLLLFGIGIAAAIAIKRSVD